MARAVVGAQAQSEKGKATTLVFLLFPDRRRLLSVMAARSEYVRYRIGVDLE